MSAAASKTNPIHSIGIYSRRYGGLNIIVDTVCTELKRYDVENELAQRVKITLANTTSNGYLLSEIVSVMDRVFIYANDGEKVDEVFRGFVWKKEYTNNRKRTIDITAYDNLIYMMQSEDSRYYPSGKTTEAIMNDICWAWGIELKYNYESITHKKLPISGKLANIITDILDRVKKNTKIKYVVKSLKDVMYIDRVGSNVNGTVYELNRSENVIFTTSTTSMDDVVTKVIILGKENDDGSYPIKETLEGDIANYGTLQKVIHDTEDENQNGKKSKTQKKSEEEDKLFENAHDEAAYILDENGQPDVKFQIKAVDIPWLRKGDLVKVNAGDMGFRYIINSAMHDGTNKIMTLDLEYADEDKLSGADNTAADASAGRTLSLTNAPIYVSSDSKSVAARITGTYYLYDGKEVSGRYRITTSTANVNKKPVGTYVTGWLPKEYVL